MDQNLSINSSLIQNQPNLDNPFTNLLVAYEHQWRYLGTTNVVNQTLNYASIQLPHEMKIKRSWERGRSSLTVNLSRNPNDLEKI